MSSLRALRRLPNYAARARHYSSAVADAPASEFAAKRLAAKEHAAHTTDLWRRMALYVCIPGCLVAGVYVKKVEDEHHAHMEHEKHEHGDEPKPEYIYLNKRAKPFPWGPNSLFFNPEANKDMSEA